MGGAGVGQAPPTAPAGGGYRFCKQCNRRFFAAGEGDFCSPVCRGAVATARAHHPGRGWLWLSLACFGGLAFVFLAGLDVHYAILVHVPGLRIWSAQMFDHEGHAGVAYLHAQLRTATTLGEDTLVTETLARCHALSAYQDRTGLVLDLDKRWDAADLRLKRAILLAWSGLGASPTRRHLVSELRDADLRADVLAMMRAVASPSFVMELAVVSREPGAKPELQEAVLGVLAAIRDPELLTVALATELSVLKDVSPRIRREAVMVLPKLLWPSPPLAPSSDKARRRWSRAVSSLSALAEGRQDAGLASAAREALERGRSERRTFVDYEALGAFEELFGGGRAGAAGS